MITIIEEIELAGTDKQIKWAKNIRKYFIENILKVIENKDIEKLLEFIKIKNQSEFWINAREMNYRYILYLAGIKTGFEEKTLIEIIQENVKEEYLECSFREVKNKYKTRKKDALKLIGLSNNLKIGDLCSIKEMCFDFGETEEESFQIAMKGIVKLSDQKTYILHIYPCGLFDIYILYQMKNTEMYKRYKDHKLYFDINVKESINKFSDEQCSIAYIELRSVYKDTFKQ